ncbi:MAG: hypothetical protein ACPGO5_03525 [Patescibacteria group bacterium]
MKKFINAVGTIAILIGLLCITVPLIKKVPDVNHPDLYISAFSAVVAIISSIYIIVVILSSGDIGFFTKSIPKNYVLLKKGVPVKILKKRTTFWRSELKGFTYEYIPDEIHLRYGPIAYQGHRIKSKIDKISYRIVFYIPPNLVNLKKYYRAGGGREVTKKLHKRNVSILNKQPQLLIPFINTIVFGYDQKSFKELMEKVFDQECYRYGCKIKSTKYSIR